MEFLQRERLAKLVLQRVDAAGDLATHVLQGGNSIGAFHAPFNLSIAEKRPFYQFALRQKAGPVALTIERNHVRSGTAKAASKNQRAGPPR